MCNYLLIAISIILQYLAGMKKLTHDQISRNRAPAGEISSIRRLPLFALAENIRSLYNVGSIFRTADAILLGKLILTGYTPIPPRKEIEKTALGSTATVPWEYNKDPIAAIRALRTAGVRIVSLEHTDRSVPHTSVQLAEFPLCLVIGNEITGVSQEVLNECDGAIEIPMFGIKHSLNVAVAFGIAVFELARVCNQR
ncbi:MAG: RNA methyltransferase [Bacteroidota bacterium]